MQDDTKSAVEGAVQNLTPALATSLTTVLSIFYDSTNPIWSILFSSAYGLFGYYLFYQQEKINRFATWIKDHPDEFVDSMVEQPAFQEGFFPTLDAYLRVRSEDKRKLVQQVFLGFAQNEDKVTFELERLFSAIETISLNGLIYLRFLNETIIPDWEIFLNAETKRIGWTRELTEKVNPLSKHIYKWIDQNFDPNTPSVKKRWGYDGSNLDILEKIYAEKQPHTDRLDQVIPEYLSLGIFRTILDGGGSVGSSASNAYTFTDFGWEFLSYLRKGS